MNEGVILERILQNKEYFGKVLTIYLVDKDNIVFGRMVLGIDKEGKILRKVINKDNNNKDIPVFLQIYIEEGECPMKQEKIEL